MFSTNEILVTGGSGLLGRELRLILAGALFPSSREFNVTEYSRIDTHLEGSSIKVILHAAAFTSPPRIDADPMRAVEVNIIGTANITRLCYRRNIRLVYVCTDYVFKGDRGNYHEDDPVHPVNKYAWSKLGGECAVRMYDKALVIRTSFGPSVFPYEKAFVDQYTSRQSVSVIARKIARLAQSDLTGVINVGGPRQTVMEYALSLDSTKSIKPIRLSEVTFQVPVDTSLDTTKYQKLFNHND
jgi:dTDP-4-dehydrorhamnose reductase